MKERLSVGVGGVEDVFSGWKKDSRLFLVYCALCTVDRELNDVC